MKNEETIENYLETIYMLIQEKGNVRAIDLSHQMNYSKATISIMLKKYMQEGYLVIEDSGNIILTELGQSIAEKMYERHNIIAKLLIALGVNEKTAYEDSCKIEHDLSVESFQSIKRYYNQHFLKK